MQKSALYWRLVVVHLCLVVHPGSVSLHPTDGDNKSPVTVVSASSHHIRVDAPQTPPPFLSHSRLASAFLAPSGKVEDDADNAIWSGERQLENRDGELRVDPIPPPLVGRWCLDCICQASSECEAVGCEGGWCGPYKISREYWIDAGRPGPYISGDPRAFQACGLNKTCAEQTIQQYMAHFARDCNGDGRIDCWDFSRLHFAGGANCHAEWIERTPFWEKFVECQEELEAVRPANNGQTGVSFARPALSGSSTSHSLLLPSSSGGVSSGSTFARPSSSSSGPFSPTSAVDPASHFVKNEPVSRMCFDCLFQVLSGCDELECASWTVNDPYQISLAYWTDAGRPGIHSNQANDFHHCARNKSCAEITIQKYMSKFGRDCNHDNNVDCLDYARIHKAGPYACDALWIETHEFWKKITKCLQKQDKLTNENVIKHGSQNVDPITFPQESPQTTDKPSTPLDTITMTWVKTSPLIVTKESHSQVLKPTSGFPVIRVTLSTVDQPNLSGDPQRWPGEKFNWAQTPSTNLPVQFWRESQSPAEIPVTEDWEDVGSFSSHAFLQEGVSERQNSRHHANDDAFNPSLPNEPTRVTHLVNSEEEPRMVDFNCLRCLCEASSGCEERSCKLGLCGPYQISEEYWLNAGWVKVTPPGKMHQEFETCASNKTCSEMTIQHYMAKQQRDCDENGIINCWDFARMHLAGAEHCHATWVNTKPEWKVFSQCQSRHDFPEKAVTSVHTLERDEGQGQVPPGRRKPPFIVVPPENERIKSAASEKQEVFVTQSFHPPEVVLGPLSNDEKILTPAIKPSPEPKFPDREPHVALPVSAPDSPSPVEPARTAVHRGNVNEALSPKCYTCLCQASTNCSDELNQCIVTGPVDYFCGIYHISKAYWIDSGKPGDVSGDPAAFERCALDADCAKRTILGYMNKFERDCDDDGVVDCADFARIHKAGPWDCGAEWVLKSAYWQRFERCWGQSKVDEIDFRILRRPGGN